MFVTPNDFIHFAGWNEPVSDDDDDDDDDEEDEEPDRAGYARARSRARMQIRVAHGRAWPARCNGDEKRDISGLRATR